MYFCWWMNINITYNHSTLSTISTSQKMGRSKSELRKIQSRTFQRHPTISTRLILGHWFEEGQSKTTKTKTWGIITLPWCLDLFPEIHGLVRVQLLLSSKRRQNILIQSYKISRKAPAERNMYQYETGGTISSKIIYVRINIAVHLTLTAMNQDSNFFFF